MHLDPTTAVIALGATAVAAVTDLRDRKVYNWLTFPLFLLGPVIRWRLNGWEGVQESLLGALLVSAILIALSVLFGRGLGGGDLKLLIALGAVIGWPSAGWLLLYTGASGIVVAVPVLLSKRSFWRTWSNLTVNMFRRYAGERSHSVAAGSTGPRLPYAVSILLGTVATIFWGALR